MSHYIYTHTKHNIYIHIQTQQYKKRNHFHDEVISLSHIKQCFYDKVVYIVQQRKVLQQQLLFYLPLNTIVVLINQKYNTYTPTCTFNNVGGVPHSEYQRATS